MSASADHAKAAQITWDEWCLRLRKPGYRYMGTEWYKAGKALEAETHAAPPPPPVPHPPPASHLDVVRNLLVFATVTDDAIQHACRLPKSWRFLFTADPAYSVMDYQITAARASGHGVYAWGDCHSPGLMPRDIQAFMRDRGLDGWYGEGESATALTRVTTATDSPPARAIVNLSALTDAQITMIAAGQVLVTAELYRNVQPNVQPDWRNANAGIGGNCIAVYASAAEGAVYTPVSAYKAAGLYNPATDSIYTEGMLAADWEALT